MGYDLVFWRQPDGYDTDPNATYVHLLEGHRVDGLVEVPTESILEAIQSRFPKSVRELNGDAEWIYSEEDGESAFEISWSAQHVVVTCRGSSNDDMNAFIDIANAHGCPLYDPQVNERFA